MTGYQIVNLLDILAADGDVQTERHLQNFYCPYNGDVEDFLHNKAVTFAKQGISSVWLVFASFQEKWRLVGYFALANKIFYLKSRKISNTLRKRLQKFATPDFELAMPLIGQLGKNYRDGYDKLITGDELLRLACDKVAEGHRIFGGRAVFVECEDVPALVRFYERNQFHVVGRRAPTREEHETFKGKPLIQLLRYLH